MKYMKGASYKYPAMSLAAIMSKLKYAFTGIPMERWQSSTDQESSQNFNQKKFKK